MGIGRFGRKELRWWPRHQEAQRHEEAGQRTVPEEGCKRGQHRDGEREQRRHQRRQGLAVPDTLEEEEEEEE